MTEEQIMDHIVEGTKEAIEQGGGPFGAAIVIDGKIIAEGYNEVYQNGDPTAHAEIQAIRKAAVSLGVHFPKGTKLYSTSQSCPMCLAAALWAGIDEIVFGASCEFDETVGMGDAPVYAYLRGDEDPEVLRQRSVCAKKAEEMLKWFEKRQNNENSR